MTPEEREYKDLELRMQLLHHCHNMLLAGVAIMVGVCGLIAFLLTNGVEIYSQVSSAYYIAEQAASTRSQDEKLATNTGNAVFKDSQDGQSTTQEKIKTSDQNIVDKKAWDIMLYATGVVSILFSVCVAAYLYEHLQFTQIIKSSDYIKKDVFTKTLVNTAAVSIFLYIFMAFAIFGGSLQIYFSESRTSRVFMYILFSAYIFVTFILYLIGGVWKTQKQKAPSIQKEDDRNTPKYYVVGVNDHEHGRTQNYTISVSRIDDDGTRDD